MNCGSKTSIAFAARGVDVGGLGPAQIVHVQLAVGEHLGVAQDDALPGCGAADGQPDPSDQVLSEVDDEPAGPPRACTATAQARRG